MGRRSRWEYFEAIWQRYHKANKALKGHILAEFKKLRDNLDPFDLSAAIDRKLKRIYSLANRRWSPRPEDDEAKLKKLVEMPILSTAEQDALRTLARHTCPTSPRWTRCRTAPSRIGRLGTAGRWRTPYPAASRGTDGPWDWASSGCALRPGPRSRTWGFVPKPQVSNSRGTVGDHSCSKCLGWPRGHRHPGSTGLIRRRSPSLAQISDGKDAVGVVGCSEPLAESRSDSAKGTGPKPVRVPFQNARTPSHKRHRGAFQRQTTTTLGYLLDVSMTARGAAFFYGLTGPAARPLLLE